MEQRYLAGLRPFFSPRDLLSNTSQIITQRTRRLTKRPSLSCQCWQINRLFHGNTSWSPAASLPKDEKDVFGPKWWKKGKNVTPSPPSPNHIMKYIYSQSFILGKPSLKCAKGSDAFNQMTGKSVFHRLPTNFRMCIMFSNGVPERPNSRIDYISSRTDIWSHLVFSVSVTMSWLGHLIPPNHRTWVDELMDSAGSEETQILIEMLAADVQKLNK